MLFYSRFHQYILIVINVNGTDGLLKSVLKCMKS